MKYYISVDIEGVAGIMNWGEASRTVNDDYDFYCDLMTAETLAVVDGINQVGSEAEIIIKDAHASGRNLRIERFPENVRLIRGWDGGPYGMMQGLDGTYDGVFFVGYHSESTSHGNPLSHTKSHTKISHIKINGKIVSEFEINSWVSAYHGVPILFLSGDQMIAEKAVSINENIRVVSTKEGIGDSVVTKTPERVVKEITRQVVESLGSDKEKCRLELPDQFEVEVAFKTFQQAYRAQFYPGVSLKDHCTVTFRTEEYYEVLRTMMFII